MQTRAPQIVSGRAAPRRTSSGAEERWWLGNLDLVVDGSVDAAGSGAHEAVIQAFGAWVSTDASLPRLTFDSGASSSVPTAPDGQNRVYFAPIDLPGHESDLGLTLAYSDSTTGQVLEADVILNKRMAFSILTPPAGSTDDDASDNDPDDDVSQTEDALTSKSKSGHAQSAWCKARYDLQSVATHEAGHFFGLGEDMTDSDATMYFSTAPCELKKRTLATLDTNAVTSLYANAPPSDSSSTNGHTGCSVVTSSVAANSHGPVPTLGLVVSVWMLRRRRRVDASGARLE
jgi:hypothetical protein